MAVDSLLGEDGEDESNLYDGSGARIILGYGMVIVITTSDLILPHASSYILHHL
jgi:hypothetical protein